jgi:hypothetical protein
MNRMLRALVAGATLVSLLGVGAIHSVTSAPAEATHVAPDMITKASGYIYAQGKQTGLTAETSASGLMTVAAPKLRNFPLTTSGVQNHNAALHSLAEVAFGTADSKNYVEVGWTVDGVGVNGSDTTNPHVFVGTWVNGNFSGYNAASGTDWVDNAAYSVNVGDSLSTVVGSDKQFGLQHFNNAWWFSYDSQWLGHVPDSHWSSQGITFTAADTFYAFGETYFDNTSLPCGQMGDGTTPTATTGPRIGNFLYASGSVNTPNLTLTTGSPYSAVFVNSTTTKTFRYGGFGEHDDACVAF